MELTNAFVPGIEGRTGVCLVRIEQHDSAGLLITVTTASDVRIPPEHALHCAGVCDALSAVRDFLSTFVGGTDDVCESEGRR